MFIFLCFCSCGSVSNYIEDNEDTRVGEYKGEHTYIGYYKYPIEDDMKAQEIEIVCRIDEKILNEMSSEQLCQAIVDYPLINVAFLSGYTICDTNRLKNSSDAYKELLTRNDAKDAFISKIMELETTTDDKVLLEMLKTVAANEPEFVAVLTRSEKEYLGIAE